MTKRPERNLKLYAERLYGRREQAVVLSWSDVSVDDWSPKPHDCHGNVTNFCAHDESYSALRGWLYFGFDGALDEVKFVAHSAVRAPDGLLYDITPSLASQQYPFIAAEEPEAEYATPYWLRIHRRQ